MAVQARPQFLPERGRGSDRHDLITRPPRMVAANFGDGDAILPWVEQKLEELCGEAPVLDG